MDWGNNKTIVVPIDFSDESFRALDEAVKMVASPSQVHVVHVLHDSVPTVSEIPVGPSKRKIRALEVEQAVRKQLADNQHKEVHVHACYGDPAVKIARFAQRVKADLIVMPSHGRGVLSHLLIGSVAEQVVRLAHCPVLILKAMKSCAAEGIISQPVSSDAGA